MNIKDNFKPSKDHWQKQPELQNKCRLKRLQTA
ncbi:hypothetical protein DE8669_2142 [Neisseria meningitidis]|uniref:Uncharacterized protein n=2 Tax=Neisseria meningitidis TaxID=487 RepID=C6SMJ1_NEIME|nr:hypothetical protein DE8669_2142 [Neisseria meningitidis]CBA09727.1 hypothetical protein predicted by Glimmer/Critica [Neisseria meningitidis alpha275]CCA45813.1 hypothetical protein NMALPHA522_2272 [Neisseria meningitidis alpha522]